MSTDARRPRPQLLREKEEDRPRDAQRRAERERESDPVRELEGQEHVGDGRSVRDVQQQQLAEVLAAFYERSAPWWRAYEREPELITAWSGGVDHYYADIENLMRAGLGDLGDHDRSVAVIASVVGPPAFFALRGRGYSSDEAVALTLEPVLPWLDARRDQLAQPGSP